MCCPAPLSLRGNQSGEAEQDSGIGLKLFGFIAELVFAFIAESCSGSSRNTVRNHPGIPFILLWIPQLFLPDRIVCPTRGHVSAFWQIQADTSHFAAGALLPSCSKAVYARAC